MITFHYSWLLLFAILVPLIARIIYNKLNPPIGDYKHDIETPVLIAVVLIVLLIFGGIFWW